MEKIFNIIGWIVVILSFIMITWFIVMFIMLARYNNCQDMEFQPSYCAKYKDF